MPTEQLVVNARQAFERTGAWLARVVGEEPTDLDCEGLCLILFGLACVHNIVACGSDSADCGAWGATAQGLAGKLAEYWTSDPSAIRHEFETGRFVTPLMAGAVSHRFGAAGRLLRRICDREWRMVNEHSLISDNPTLLWAGTRLISFIRGERPQPLRAAWRMSIETIPPPYAIDPPLVRQITAELAILSAYGNLPLRLSSSFSDHLRARLASLMFFYLKDDDLETVCLLLRALNYLELRSVPEFVQGIEFVVQHNDRYGRFGMNRVASRLNAVRGGRDLTRTMFLPLSVSALWTLAECLFPARAPFALTVDRSLPT